ncbi:MAG: dihydrofolate reductase [Bacteroidales bacterium]
MVSIIVAIADNSAIGRNNQLLWHITEDLKYFKRVTGGHTVIMGRKTWESIGRPLPNRRNIVISRSLAGNPAKEVSGIEIFPSIEAVLKTTSNSDEEIFIIGGGEIYRQAFPLANRLYLTLVHTTIEDADTFFPTIDYSQWREIFRESHQHKQGEKFEYPFEFVVLER